MVQWNNTKSIELADVEKGRTHNKGFGNIGAGRCNLHHQQHCSSCSGRTNIGGLLVVILYICFSIGSGYGRTEF